MKRTELSNAGHLRPQKPSARDTSHVTIETNTTCNIRCRACYAIEHPMVKTLSQVKAEIDLAATRRNLDTVSLLGGEPTLHPDLVEIVRYVKGRGFVCQVLTNGIKFLHDGDLDLLDDLADAGVDRFLLHVDTGQSHVHPDIDAARHRLAALFEERRVWFGLSLTLYDGEEEDLPRILKDFARYQFFDGVLVTLAFDFARVFDPEKKPRFAVDMARVAHALQDSLGVEPSAYLPSNLDDDEVCWLMYFYWVNAQTGATLAVSPELNRLIKRLYRAAKGHEFFGATMNPRTLGLQLAATGVAEGLIHPGRLGEITHLLLEGHGTEHLRFHYVVIQQAPRVHPEEQAMEFCWHCPDATVRDGRLVPVCMAGRLDPLGDHDPTAPRRIVEQVYAHLEERPPV